jgi:hypothetical protein
MIEFIRGRIQEYEQQLRHLHSCINDEMKAHARSRDAHALWFLNREVRTCRILIEELGEVLAEAQRQTS